MTCAFVFLCIHIIFVFLCTQIFVRIFQLANDELDFFPISRAMTLEIQIDPQELRLRYLETKLEYLVKRVKELVGVRARASARACVFLCVFLCGLGWVHVYVSVYVCQGL